MTAASPEDRIRATRIVDTLDAAVESLPPDCRPRNVDPAVCPHPAVERWHGRSGRVYCGDCGGRLEAYESTDGKEPPMSDNLDALLASARRAQNNRAGWAFAHKLADPAFRQRLKEAGWTGGTVYPVGPDDTEANVRARMDRGRHLLVVEDAAAPDGLRIEIVKVSR